MTRAAPAARPSRVVASRAADATATGGLVLLAVGTFLPWLDSGRSRRNSYATGGVLHRLLDVSGWAERALTAWPFVGLVCALAVAAILLGHPGLAAVPGLFAAACGAVVGVAALSADTHTALVRVAPVGPSVTLAGSVATLVGVTVRLVVVDKIRH